MTGMVRKDNRVFDRIVDSKTGKPFNRHKATGDRVIERARRRTWLIFWIFPVYTDDTIVGSNRQ